VPRKLFHHFVKLLGGLDIRLDEPHRSVIAAALVDHIYSWNSVCDWRETRNLVASILRQLRPSRAKRLLQDASARETLRAALDELGANPLYSRRAVSEIPSYVVSTIRSFMEKLAEGASSIASECREFSTWLRGQSDFRIGATASIFAEIPGVTGIAIGGARHPHENEASTLFALMLVELLAMAYGSSRDTVNDAHLIMTRAFADFPWAVLEYEALRAARLRKRADVPAVQSDLGLRVMWLNMQELAEKLGSERS